MKSESKQAETNTIHFKRRSDAALNTSVGAIGRLNSLEAECASLEERRIPLADAGRNARRSASDARRRFELLGDAHRGGRGPPSRRFFFFFVFFFFFFLCSLFFSNQIFFLKKTHTPATPNLFRRSTRTLSAPSAPSTLSGASWTRRARVRAS
jgi:hypothetical protein